jgi:L-ascorbate metabolism protein UlaG (beta-lactamase superfamily)
MSGIKLLFEVKRNLVTIFLFIAIAFLFSCCGSDTCQENKNTETGKSSTETTPNSVPFTYLIADAVDFGSTAFRIGDEKSSVIYIESFPDSKSCMFDPFEITKADLIIQNVHGHPSHYNPDVCAKVAIKTGALVLGNAKFKEDMLAREVPIEKIIELSPDQGNKAATDIESLGLKVTAYSMEHTMMPGTMVDTYLIEMADGVRWYHGTCSSGPETMKWMLKHPELKDLDVMIIDCDMDFTSIKSQFQPKVMIRCHDFESTVKPAPATVYTNYPEEKLILENGQTWLYEPISSINPSQ